MFYNGWLPNHTRRTILHFISYTFNLYYYNYVSFYTVSQLRAITFLYVFILLFFSFSFFMQCFLLFPFFVNDSYFYCTEREKRNKKNYRRENGFIFILSFFSALLVFFVCYVMLNRCTVSFLFFCCNYWMIQICGWKEI